MHTKKDFRPKRHALRESRLRLQGVRWMLFAIAAVQGIVTVIASIVFSFFDAPPSAYLQLLLIELLAYLLPLGIYTHTNQLFSLSEAKERLGLRWCKHKFWPWVLLAGIGCQFIMILVNLPVNLVLGGTETVLPTNPWELLAAIFVVAIIPAICEEYLFRGIVYGVMKEFNSCAAAIFTTVMFAFLHGSMEGFLGYLVLGAGSLLILRRTGSLYAGIGFHLMNNITALLLSYFSESLLYFPATTLWLFLTGVLLAGLALTALCVLTRPAKPIREVRTSDLLVQSIINLPIFLCVACVVGVLILQ